MHDFDVDADNRPFKRQRLGPQELKPLPLDILLLSLPHLLAHPPTHRQHTRSVILSLSALRGYLAQPNLEPRLECRAWTELAEAGFRLGLNTPGIENEVERAITRALMITHKHPSLRIYKPQLTRLSAQLAIHQNNSRLAQNILKKILVSFILPTDPPHAQYSAHLAYIDSLSDSKSIGAIRELHTLASHNNHTDVSLFATVLELHHLLKNGMWNNVRQSLGSIEKTFTEIPRTNIQKALMMHVLIMGVLYHTYVGEYENSQSRIKKLHEMLDGGALEALGSSGIVEIELANSHPLRVQVTHPRVLYTLGFLVSSISKRDPVGRKPKRRLYAEEGVLTVERELKKELALPIWASVSDLKEMQERFHKMRADMLCELIGVAISRSEFDDAERRLSQVIAETRTHGLFALFSARITLHQAHLAHGLGRPERALKCYQVAAYLSRRRAPNEIRFDDKYGEDTDGCEDPWVNVSARAGELWLRIGLASEQTDEGTREYEMEILRARAVDVVKECEGCGGTLQAVGAVLAACLSKEFLATKTHLRTALNLTTAASDNHLRALVLALVAAQYVHTSTEHAETMLNTAELLAAGLGAQPKANKGTDGGKNSAAPTSNIKSADNVGNAHLRLWIGERALELKRRNADDQGASKQELINKRFEEAVAKVRKRKFGEVD
ncbi:hypothetical protein JR316_0000090 [Psilocybe cubensis]|uniref:Uncharacterized protein n=2 Tax=Psilocybe cubensis TaxID=181762 RepID=A0ACB8HEW8_PSICU|nr:hypothetical protein JR316_0000090 [Psilocybe cubensis]KAH9486026.1 hypothetical protein JR316_0000090 [Psilocybe cubensis]